MGPATGAAAVMPSEPARPREARLRYQFAAMYPGIAPGVWTNAATMTDMVVVVRLRRGEVAVLQRDRVLDPDHFIFRYGGGERPGNPHPRERASDRGELFQ